MKKLRNILFSLLAIMSTLIMTNVEAGSTAPGSMDISASDYHMLYGSEILGHGSTITFRFKKNTEGKIVYCINSNLLSVTSGTMKFYLSGEAEPKYTYILENGYPSKSITGDADTDYFITTLAVWYFTDNYDGIFSYFDFDKGTYKGYDSVVAKEAGKLINGAKTYSYSNPSIKINSGNSNLTLANDGKYYVSQSMGITSSKVSGNYNVSLENAPRGTIITDINGKEKSSFTTNEKFIIKVPVNGIKSLSSEFKVNVSAVGSINKAYTYKPTDSAYQGVATLYPETIDVKDSTTLKLDIKTRVEISKKDVTTGEELPGATLTVKDASGKVIDKWVSTNEVHVIEGLSVGKYTLTEEIAPEGYELSKETVEFEIKADGTATKVVMYNKPKAVICISKQDITTKEELPGAHLEIRNEKGEVVEAWVSGDTPHAITGLKAGKYTLTETLAPEGYELSKETIEFVVKEDGTVDGEIVMYNKPETIVEVPSTSSFKTITTSLIGIIIIGLGAIVIYRNYKKNEEN